MNAILGLNEMVLRDSADDNIRMYSESIRTAGSTLLGIINDILDFSKIEAGRIKQSILASGSYRPGRFDFVT